MSWSYAYSSGIWPALISVALTAFIGWYSWSRREVPGARPFAIAALFGALWALGSVLEISAAEFSTKVFWVKFETVWQLPSATAITCFVLIYAGLGRWLTRRNLILLTIPPVIVLALIITNDYHHLVWTGFQMDEYVLKFPGSANRPMVGYAYFLALINFTTLLWLAVRSPQHSRPVAIMLFGQITGRGLYLADNIYPNFLGPGESVLVVVGLISATYAIALFRFHVFDPVPLARSAVIQQMNEGMLVIDLQGRIADLNTAAASILGKSAADLLMHPVTEVLPSNLDLLELTNKASLAPFEISLGSGKTLRYYDVNVTPLLDKRDQALGQLLLLREITEQKRTRAQIQEQQRVVATLQERERLARELHDSTGQVLGYVKLQAETIRKWLETGNNQKAGALLARLAEAAKDAHADVRESILGLKTGLDGEWSFFPVLRRYLDDFQTRYGIRTEMVLPEGLKAGSLELSAEVQLLRVIQEALTNARKHSSARAIRVAFEPVGGRVIITVTDDGTGFNAGQLSRDTGDHFGLGFMRERMEQIGGSIFIDSRPGAGTVVKLEAPLWNQQEEIA